MKKIKAMFKLLLIAMVLYAPKAMALTCTMGEEKLVIGGTGSTNNIELNAQVPKIVHTIIVIIKVAVPIILIILGMLDLLKGVTASKEDEIKKGQNMFFKRLIAAVIVFFVITVVQLLISFVDTDKEGIMDCANCFINGKCGTPSAKEKAATRICNDLDGELVREGTACRFVSENDGNTYTCNILKCSNKDAYYCDGITTCD